MPRRFHGVLATAALAAIGCLSAASAVPPGGTGKINLPNPSLLKSYTTPLFDMPQGTFVAQFNPTKGQLRSISAKLSGIARYKITLAGNPGPNVDYAFTAYAPAYLWGGNAWFDLTATGAGKYAFDTVQNISGQASGGGAVKGTDTLKVFSGNGNVRLVLTPDPPQFTKGKMQIAKSEPGQSSISGTVTYTYLPAIPKITKLPQ